MTFPKIFITFVRSEKQYIIMRHDPSKRISPRHISALRDNEIFVFGSNLQGMHGGGAARPIQVAAEPQLGLDEARKG